MPRKKARGRDPAVSEKLAAKMALKKRPKDPYKGKKPGQEDR